MAKSLAEYAAENPQEMPASEREQRQIMASLREQVAEREQEQKTVERLKASIIAQLERGTAPQYPLYSALEVIGILTHDDEFTQTGKRLIDSVYDEVAQQTLVDDAALIASKIEEMQASYNARLRKQLEKQLSGYQKIARGLNDALAALDDMEA